MKYKIEHHQPTDNGYFHLTVDAPKIAAMAKPGQFLMIRVTDSTHDPLLRRPISIMNVAENRYVEMLYKVVGRGTELLSNASAGCDLDVVGPLGNGFQLPDHCYTALLVGGGIGIPPLVYLSRELKREKNVNTMAFLGARSSADLPMVQRFTEIDIPVHLATESGEVGVKGFVTEPLISVLDNWQEENSPVIFACGPDPMLKALQKLGRNRNIQTWLSLEEHMGCGVGACLGCVVETTTGFQRVCHDGPVFNADVLMKWS